MPSQRISSQTASRDCCCCGCLTKIRLLGRSQGKCLLLLVRSTGREMLDVRGTSTARKCLRQLVLSSQSWNKVSTTCMDHLDLRLSCTRMSMTFCLRSRIQGCFATSRAQASFETTVRLGCVLRKDHLQRWQSHQGDTNQVNDES